MFSTHKICLDLGASTRPSKTGQAYRLYTDASDYAIAGALQQLQYIAIKDLKGTRAYKKLNEAYKKGDKVPDLMTKIIKGI